METIYDWVSLAIFAGLIVLFLQRSVGERAEKDASLFYYLGAGAGCAVANYFGNEGQDLVAIVIAGSNDRVDHLLPQAVQAEARFLRRYPMPPKRPSLRR